MSRRIKNFELNAAKITTPGDGTGTRICVGTEGFDSFCVITETGSARVYGSLDGTNFLAKQLVLCQEPPNSGDTISSQDPVYVGVTTAGIPAWFFGDYKAIKIIQNGATAVTGRVSAAGEKFT